MNFFVVNFYIDLFQENPLTLPPVKDFKLFS